jgi:hypothetical protein
MQRKNTFIIEDNCNCNTLKKTIITIIPSPSFNTRKDRDNWVMAHPLLLRWNGMRWEPRRAMNNQPMNILEARILTI